MATPSFFTALEVRPALGRFFLSSEDRLPAGDPVAVISYALWQREYAGERSVLGRGSRSAGRSSRSWASRRAASRAWMWRAWTSGSRSHEALLLRRPQVGRAWRVVDRIVSPARRPRRPRAGRDGGDLRTGAGAARGRPRDPPVHAILMPISGSRDADGSPTTRARVALWLSGFSLVVLLIAIANVSNLVLARTMLRRRELGIRFALGGTRSRVARLLMTESLLLAASGFSVSLFVAGAGTAFLRRVLLADVAWDGLMLGGRARFSARGAALVIGVIIGVIPVMQLARREYVASIGSQSVRSMRAASGCAATAAVASDAGDRAARGRRSLRSEPRAREGDGSGIRRESRAGRQFWTQRPRCRGDLLAARVCGTARKAGARGRERHARRAVLRASGHRFAFLARSDARKSQIEFRLGRLFPRTRHALRAGREFTPADGEPAPKVVVVNETLARTLWPGKEAVGQCVLAAMTPPVRPSWASLPTRTFSVCERSQNATVHPDGSALQRGYPEAPCRPHHWRSCARRRERASHPARTRAGACST